MARFPLTSVLSAQSLSRAIELVLALALALALADLAWLLLPAPAGKTASGQAAPLRPATAALPDTGASDRLSPAVLGLFGLAGASGSGAMYTDSALSETTLDLTLKGILASRGSRQLALIAQGDEREEIYRVGDSIAGAQIARIKARRVILARNGNSESLTLETIAPRRGSSFAGRGVTEDITMISARERLVSRNLFDRQMQILPQVLNQAQTLPYWDQNGQEAGFRVVNIESGSVFEQLGLQQQDVIVAVNGMAVRNNREALAAYQSFKSADALQLGLLRDGQELTIDFSIR